MRDDQERLADIQEAIRRIERYAARGKAAFDADEFVQSWMVQHLQIIGEACRGLFQAFKDAHPEVPWDEIVAMDWLSMMTASFERARDVTEGRVTFTEDVPECRPPTVAFQRIGELAVLRGDRRAEAYLRACAAKVEGWHCDQARQYLSALDRRRATWNKRAKRPGGTRSTSGSGSSTAPRSRSTGAR